MSNKRRVSVVFTALLSVLILQINKQLQGPLTALMSPSWRHTSCTWTPQRCSWRCRRYSPRTRHRRPVWTASLAFKHTQNTDWVAFYRIFTLPARSPAESLDTLLSHWGSSQTLHQTCRHEHFSHSFIHSLTERLCSLQPRFSSLHSNIAKEIKKVLPGGTLLVSHDRKPGLGGVKKTQCYRWK